MRAAALMLLLALAVVLPPARADEAAGNLRARAEISPGMTGPRALRGTCERPRYPLPSLRAGDEGITALRLYIDENGAVTRAPVISTSGHELLDLATTDAYASCRFEPARTADGEARASTMLLQYRWRLQDAPRDPWAQLLLARIDTHPSTVDLAAVPFAGDSAITPAQRLKILRRLQQEATRQTHCGSVESVQAGPPPAGLQFTPEIDPTTGAPLRIVRELWTVNECEVPMRYALTARFPQAADANFRMVPLPAEPASAAH